MSPGERKRRKGKRYILAFPATRKAKNSSLHLFLVPVKNASNLRARFENIAKNNDEEARKRVEEEKRQRQEKDKKV